MNRIVGYVLVMFVGAVSSAWGNDSASPSLPEQAVKILKDRCYRCHGGRDSRRDWMS